MDRIRRRDLYKFVNEFTVPKERVQDFVVPSAEDITTCQRDNDVPGGLKPEDVIVQVCVFSLLLKGIIYYHRDHLRGGLGA